VNCRELVTCYHVRGAPKCDAAAPRAARFQTESSAVMSDAFALQPAALDPSRARLAELELRLAAREREVATLTRELQALQAKYLDAVGPHYRQLVDLERSIAEIEVRLGLRDPLEDAEDSTDADAGEASVDDDGCTERGMPTADLKAMFRKLARTIHPDLAVDEPARWRRHSLMAEANRAYAERDEDRLRLILHAWERDPDSALAGEEHAPAQVVRRRITRIEDRLVAIDTEIADLRASAIGRLQHKLAAATAQGWDLLAEMVAEVQREVRRSSARLASLNKTFGIQQ